MASLKTPDAIVIGAGLAGLSAAVRLAGAGARVLVLEARSRLGGRATSFVDQRSGEIVDNGQHVMLGCYTETFAFLQEIGATANVRVQPQLSLTMIDRAGVRSRLDCPPLPAPFHLVAGAMEWDALSWADRLALLRIGAPLRLARRVLHGDARVAAASPGESVESWLVRHGQTDRLREMLWRPLALAALNEEPARAAAPLFARVLAEMFGGDPRGAAIALPIKPLLQMYAEPARDYLLSRGGDVQTGMAGKIRIEQDRVVAVETLDERWTPPVVICAVPWFAIADALVGDLGGLSALIARAREMASSPIVTVNLWFDREMIGEPFVGFPERTMQWAFDKGKLFGGQATHLSLVASAADGVIELENREIIALARDELMEAFPNNRAARLTQATVFREPRATFSLAPGQPERPSSATAVAGLFLAGDWIATGLPATIESAVRSGHTAAGLAI